MKREVLIATVPFYPNIHSFRNGQNDPLECLMWSDIKSEGTNKYNLSYRYHEADMRTGRATFWQLTSLQAFWPGLQVNFGNYNTFSVWKFEWGRILFIIVMAVRFLLGTLQLLTHHTVNFSTYGINLEYFLRGKIFVFSCGLVLLWSNG